MQKVRKYDTFYKIVRKGGILSQNVVKLAHLTRLQMTSPFMVQKSKKVTLVDIVTINDFP